MSGPSRRSVLSGGAACFAWSSFAQPAPQTTAMPQPDSAMADRIAAEFVAGRPVQDSGLSLDIPAQPDDPAAVRVRIRVTLPWTPQDWCSELILLADLNPTPLASHMRFQQALGVVDVSTRLRLIGSMPVRSYARLGDGRVLMARHQVVVLPGGCGM